MNEEQIIVEEHPGQSITLQVIEDTLREMLGNDNEDSSTDTVATVNSEEESPLTEEEQAILNQAIEELHQEIPTNSATLLINDATSRFSSAIWYENIQTKTITLAGIGGIGSWLALLLARMNPANLFIYDDDVVETANMSGQLYGVYDVGSYKVSALADIIKKYANYVRIFAIRERFTYESEAADIMICGFDNMAARKLFFDKWVNYVQSKPEEERKNCLFIDGRIKC